MCHVESAGFGIKASLHQLIRIQRTVPLRGGPGHAEMQKFPCSYLFFITRSQCMILRQPMRLLFSLPLVLGKDVTCSAFILISRST